MNGIPELFSCLSDLIFYNVLYISRPINSHYFRSETLYISLSYVAKATIKRKIRVSHILQSKIWSHAFMTALD